MQASPCTPPCAQGCVFALAADSLKKRLRLRCPSCRKIVFAGVQGDRCGVWQHSACVGVDPSKLPDQHLCEWCRATLADPFWEPLNRDLLAPFVLRATPNRPPAYLTPGERVSCSTCHGAGGTAGVGAGPPF